MSGTEIKMSKVDIWISELTVEYRKCLSKRQNTEAKQVLQLITILLSNYGIGYPFLKKLNKLKKKVTSPYLTKKIDEIYIAWSKGSA